MKLIIILLLTVSCYSQTGTVALSNNIGENTYESKDHRSNVYEVVSDRKTINNNQFKGIIIAATDYYPYGSEIGARSFNGDYKYGFQGQEKDEEVKGKGNTNNYKYRMHDARVGRFFAVDPLAGKFPHNSTYAFSENTVVNAVELEGREKWKSIALAFYQLYIQPIEDFKKAFIEFDNNLKGDTRWSEQSYVGSGDNSFNLYGFNFTAAEGDGNGILGTPIRDMDASYLPGASLLPKPKPNFYRPSVGAYKNNFINSKNNYKIDSKSISEQLQKIEKKIANPVLKVEKTIESIITNDKFPSQTIKTDENESLNVEPTEKYDYGLKYFIFPDKNNPRYAEIGGSILIINNEKKEEIESFVNKKARSKEDVEDEFGNNVSFEEK